MTSKTSALCGAFTNPEGNLSAQAGAEILF